MRTLALRALQAVQASAIRFRFGFDCDSLSLDSLLLEEPRARSMIDKRTNNEWGCREGTCCDLAHMETDTWRSWTFKNCCAILLVEFPPPYWP